MPINIVIIIIAIVQVQTVCKLTIDPEHSSSNLFIVIILHRKICSIFNKTAPQPNCGLTFDDLVRVVYTLPPLVQEKLASVCPSFKDFMDSKNSGLLVQMQVSDAKTTIQRMLDLLPIDLESAVLGAVVKEFRVKHGSLRDVFSHFETRQRSNTDPRDDRLSPVNMTISQSREDNTQFAFTDLPTPPVAMPSKIPARNYHSESTAANSGSIEQSSAMISTQITNRDTKHITVKTRYVTQLPDTEISGSSSIGAPIAQSTPCGTMSRRVSQKHNINSPAVPKTRKKKSRWNFAARFCSNKRSTAFSDSDSVDTSSVHRTSTKTKRKRKSKH